MRTVIVLAIGIYLGRQLYLYHDLAKANQKQERIRQKLTGLLRQQGINQRDAEKQVNEAMKD